MMAQALIIIITAACPLGYTLMPGDVPGYGSISTHSNTATENECSGLCDKHSSCCSFEYSKTYLYCNLNTECRPTQGPWPTWSTDDLFCSRTIRTGKQRNSCPRGRSRAAGKKFGNFIVVAQIISDEPPFTMVGSTMLYHIQTPSTYDEAIKSCESYGARLVEFWDEQEYSEVISYEFIISYSAQWVPAGRG